MKNFLFLLILVISLFFIDILFLIYNLNILIYFNIFIKVFILYIFYLFRDPYFEVNKINSIISPADGIISKISNSSITIRSSLHDKYIKYAPIDGVINNIFYYNEHHRDFPNGIEIEIVGDITVKIIVYAKYNKVYLNVHKKQKINKYDKIMYCSFFSYTVLYFSFSNYILLSENMYVNSCISHLCLLKGNQ